MMSKKSKLVIEFDNDKAREHFARWLCGSGEQEYWEWMKFREEEEAGNITALEFEYFHVKDDSLGVDDPKRYGKFLETGIITTICGRKTK
jgi:hypothetical protein